MCDTGAKTVRLDAKSAGQLLASSPEPSPVPSALVSAIRIFKHRGVPTSPTVLQLPSDGSSVSIGRAISNGAPLHQICLARSMDSPRVSMHHIGCGASLEEAAFLRARIYGHMRTRAGRRGHTACHAVRRLLCSHCRQT